MEITLPLGIRIRVDGGAFLSRRQRLNLIAGTGMAIAAADDSTASETDVTLTGHAESHTHVFHTGIGADDHHAQTHTHASHSSIGANDHHNQSHDHSAAGDSQTVQPATLVVPNAAGGPTLDAVGKTGIDSTSGSFHFHDGTAERKLSPIKSKAFVLETPVAADDIPVWRTDVAFTLVEVHYLCIGGTNWIGQLQEADANGINGVDTQSADTTASAATDAEVTSFSNAAFDAGDYVRLKSTSISGTPTLLVVTFMYREDP